MLLIDAHVHIYDCFDLKTFFDSAYANFLSAAKKLGNENDFTGILLMAEAAKDNWLGRLADCADGKQMPQGHNAGDWTFRHTDENYSLAARIDNLKSLILIAGRQVVTDEGIEVLALCTSDGFNDGKPASDLIAEIKEKGGLPVIPWGAGKWLGHRGRIVKNIVVGHTGCFFLGDNRNRPNFWRQPTLFKLAEQKGIGLLPGSDPLPLNSESGRAGSYGFSTRRQIDLKRPAASVKQILRDGAAIGSGRFGKLEDSYRFFLNQMRMQIIRRRSTARRG
jgi:hypothetical protein